jgi:glycosyltransferase involved in cell wall biosynthesis
MTEPEKIEIPSFDRRSMRGRRTRYCIVIPTINESHRISNQLARMQAAGIMRLADVIIADGGSTDGSLDLAGLQSRDVCALLVKTGPGKLSAQLRMAYAYALEEGYDGVVTIDGNGKDSVESIPMFIGALEDGVDYAQASRFIAGGGAINTPLMRTWAIKLLHAPLLSLAAGRRFTDTTQGFRAYSRRYLTHPMVQPFRDVFQMYELLAYLTVRASQLGLRVVEIPTTRTYPPGSVPTKITGRHYMALMATLLRTALRRYHPRIG